MTSVVLRGRPRSASADRAILDAVAELLGEVGYSETTMAGVAARAGVSTATLYRRYSSKEELTVAALEALVEPTPPVDTGSLESDLRAILERMVQKMQGERSVVFLGLAGELLRDAALAAAVRERLTGPLRDRVVAIIDRAVARGEISPPCDPDVVLSLLLGPLHYRLLVTGEALDESLVDRLLPLLLKALS